MLARVETSQIRWNKASDKWRLMSREDRNMMGGPTVARQKAAVAGGVAQRKAPRKRRDAPQTLIHAPGERWLRARNPSTPYSGARARGVE